MLMYPGSTGDLHNCLGRRLSPEKNNGSICEILKAEDVSSGIQYEP